METDQKTEITDVTLLAQQMKESTRLSMDDQHFLKNLHINLRNPVLPQHEIESRAGSRPPTQEETKKFKQLVAIKKGSYNFAEDQIITHNWTTFCKLHNWDPKKVEPFILLRDNQKTHIRSKKQRRKFVQFLADGLPNRTLYSVYHRFKNLYSDLEQRRFRPEEDKMILDHLERNVNLDKKRKYSDLAKVLKRTRAAIWRRYKLLRKEHKRSTKFSYNLH
ncbi:uncharacterized protein LOC143430457 [Xylocopa sonorina]|uniref:uncharacterized protein LOC143430457 n=1 Tax=Xylocopa sonorina TaxID=1818115 RepID=UPI00403AEEA7